MGYRATATAILAPVAPGVVCTGTDAGTDFRRRWAAAYSAPVGRHGGRQAPLVGRAAETSELDEQFRRSLRGEFRCVLVDGEPGVGKTRLASAFLTRHRVRAVTLRARGHPSGAAASFGLWAEVFDSHLRARSRDEVTRLCGGLVEDLAGLLRTAAAVRGSWRADVPMRVREAFTVLLANIARERPVVVLLDDLHLADASSWEALGYLARNLADARCSSSPVHGSDELVERSVVGRHVLFGLEQEGVLSRLCCDPCKHPTCASSPSASSFALRSRPLW